MIGGVQRWSRRERGASAVEVAFVFPIFLLFFVAGGSLVWFVAARSALSEGAREGARFASIPNDPIGCTGTCPVGYREYPSESQVDAQVVDKTPLLDVAYADVEVCHYRSSSPPSDFATSPDCIDVDDVSPNDKVAVRVTHTVPDVFKPFTALFGLGDMVQVTEGGARSE